jgi:uncharacterized membrane protein YjfL (UPF0719 family)
MYLAAVDFGTLSLDALAQGVVAAILYFLVGIAILVAGFLMVDVLTPGDLRRMVFVDRRPNAVVLTSSMYLALAIVIVTAIVTSSKDLGQGLLDVAVYGFIGILLQGVALLMLHVVIPGDFHEHVDEAELHPAAFATAIMLLAVGGVTAGALS